MEKSKNFSEDKESVLIKNASNFLGVNPQSAINVWATDLSCLRESEIHKCRICSRFYSQDVFFVCKSSSLLLSVTETISTAAIVGDYYVFLPVTKRDCSSGGTPEYPLHATLLGHKKSQSFVLFPLRLWVGWRDKKLFR